MKVPNYLNMKVSDTYLKQTQAAQRKNGRNTRTTSEPPKARKDEIVLSPLANEVQKLEGLQKSIPEVRQEKIEAIRNQIESRTYNVSGRLVAKSILDLLS